MLSTLENACLPARKETGKTVFPREVLREVGSSNPGILSKEVPRQGQAMMT